MENCEEEQPLHSEKEATSRIYEVQCEEIAQVQNVETQNLVSVETSLREQEKLLAEKTLLHYQLLNENEAFKKNTEITASLRNKTTEKMKKVAETMVVFIDSFNAVSKVMQHISSDADHVESEKTRISDFVQDFRDKCHIKSKCYNEKISFLSKDLASASNKCLKRTEMLKSAAILKNNETSSLHQQNVVKTRKISETMAENKILRVILESKNRRADFLKSKVKDNINAETVKKLKLISEDNEKRVAELLSKKDTTTENIESAKVILSELENLPDLKTELENLKQKSVSLISDLKSLQEKFEDESMNVKVQIAEISVQQCELDEEANMLERDNIFLDEEILLLENDINDYNIPLREKETELSNLKRIEADYVLMGEEEENIFMKTDNEIRNLILAEETLREKNLEDTSGLESEALKEQYEITKAELSTVQKEAEENEIEMNLLSDSLKENRSSLQKDIKHTQEKLNLFKKSVEDKINAAKNRREASLRKLQEDISKHLQEIKIRQENDAKKYLAEINKLKESIRIAELQNVELETSSQNLKKEVEIKIKELSSADTTEQRKSELEKGQLNQEIFGTKKYKFDVSPSSFRPSKFDSSSLSDIGTNLGKVPKFDFQLKKQKISDEESGIKLPVLEKEQEVNKGLLNQPEINGGKFKSQNLPVSVFSCSSTSEDEMNSLKKDGKFEAGIGKLGSVSGDLTALEKKEESNKVRLNQQLNVGPRKYNFKTPSTVFPASRYSSSSMSEDEANLLKRREAILKRRRRMLNTRGATKQQKLMKPLSPVTADSSIPPSQKSFDEIFDSLRDNTPSSMVIGTKTRKRRIIL